MVCVDSSLRCDPGFLELVGGADDLGPLVGVSDGMEVRLPESAFRRHGLILGKPGVDRSVAFGHILAHRFRRMAQGVEREAVVVIAPDADFVQAVLRLVPLELADRVRLLDFGGAGRVPGLNLLDPMLFPHRDRCVGVIVGAVRNLWERWTGPLDAALTMSLSMIYEYNRHPDTGPAGMLTVLDVPALLDGGLEVDGLAVDWVVADSFQEGVLARVDDSRLRRWFRAFMDSGGDARGEVLTLLCGGINAWSARDSARSVLGQRESTVDFGGFLSGGQIVLVSTGALSAGVQPAALVGGAVVSLLESALRGQEHLPAGERSRCLLVCDDFPALAGVRWDLLLADARKYGGALLLGAGTLAPLHAGDWRVAVGILDNVGVRLTYGPGVAGEVSPTGMVSEGCRVQLVGDGRAYPAFTMRNLPFPAGVPGPDGVPGSDVERAVLEASVSYTSVPAFEGVSPRFRGRT